MYITGSIVFAENTVKTTKHTWEKELTVYFIFIHSYPHCNLHIVFYKQCRPLVTCGIRLPNQFEVLRASGFTFVIRT